MRRGTWVGIIVGAAAAIGGCIAHGASQIEHGNVSFDVSPTGEQIVFAAADGDLYLLSLKTPGVTRLTNTKATESSPAFSPDGSSIVYASEVSGDKGTALFVRSLDGKRVQQVTQPKGRSDADPVYAPDGKQIAFVAAHRYRPYSMGGWTWDNYDVYLMQADGSRLRRLTRANYYQAASPNITPDGKSVLYAADVPYDREFFDNSMGGSMTTILEVDASGSKAPRLLVPLPKPKMNFGAWASAPHLSRDGGTITFIGDRKQPFNYDVYLMNRNGTGIQSLGAIGVSRYNQNAVPMPDGKSVLFLAGTEANASSRPIFSLWQVDLTGGKPRRIASSELFTHPLQWKPQE
jgi:Tol biopolymer transport system component